MSFLFEGKCSLISPGKTTRFMFHIDHTAKQLRVQIDDREPDTRSFEAWMALFKGMIAAPKGLLAALVEPAQENVAVLASLAGVGPGLLNKVDLRRDADGVTAILGSKRCDKSDFSAQGKTVVDFSGIDFSGVSFVETDFSQARLAGTILSNCSFERCTFGRRQLSMSRLNGADFTRQELQDLDLSGANLDGAKFDGSSVQGCNLANASLSNASVHRARFQSTNLSYAKLNGMQGTATLFLDCNFAFASLKNVALARPVFSGSQLVSIDATEASLIDARFGRLTAEDLFEHIRPRAGLRGNPLDNAAAINLANFSKAILSRARFDGVRITESQFHDAKMDKTILSGSTLYWTSFKDADLAGADFSARDAEYLNGVFQRDPSPVASFDNVDLDHANLQGSNFRGAMLSGKVKHARLPQRDTSKAVFMCLAGATFRSALLGKDWSYIDASGATIELDLPSDTDVIGFKARQSILPMMDFAGLRLPDANFEAAQLRNMRFGNCQLEGVKFGKALLEGADFTGANLQDADFSHATLMHANFASTWMWGATFSGTVLTGANFASAMLAEVNFKGISDGQLSYVNFSGACLVSASFSNIKAPSSGDRRTNFSSACLAGADFAGASLKDVVLTSAQLAAQAGTITVVHRLKPEGKELSYERTALDPSITGPNTTCPDGKGGTCSIKQLHHFAVPKRWPSVAF